MTKRISGLTLIELLVVLVILSILAAAAIPYAEVTTQRNKELELHRALREIRTAIDRFHADWERGRIPHAEAASADGYPKSLLVLVNGVDLADVTGGRRYYLRRIPRDPFADQRTPPARQWAKRGYQDRPDTARWNRRDVYDVHSRSERTALDGSRYDEW